METEEGQKPVEGRRSHQKGPKEMITSTKKKKGKFSIICEKADIDKVLDGDGQDQY
jgi:hypothetical protein